MCGRSPCRRRDSPPYCAIGEIHGEPAHLTLVDGDGPGQFEWQLLAANVEPAPNLEHPALAFQHLRGATQETHAGQTCGPVSGELVWHRAFILIHDMSVRLIGLTSERTRVCTSDRTRVCT